MEAETSKSQVDKDFSDSERVYAYHLWPCSPILAQFVYHNKSIFEGKAVLELGCGGTGVPGIMASKCGAANVIFTDRSDNERALKVSLYFY